MQLIKLIFIIIPNFHRLDFVQKPPFYITIQLKTYLQQFLFFVNIT